MDFSVLMSVYINESPEFLQRALVSVWEEQTVIPSEMVLVEDGPLNDDLYMVIKEWKNRLGHKLKVVSLEKNYGLGDALNIGLRHCEYDLVARMDSDDISISTRFEKQIYVIGCLNVDVLSAWVQEFHQKEDICFGLKRIPEHHNDIVRYSKRRNPINHPAVMFRKHKVLEAGGYKKMHLFEDYYLWVRMILGDALFYNIQEPLVKMRVGNGQLSRRMGISYFVAEFRFQYHIYENNFISLMGLVTNFFLRCLPRIMPKYIVSRIYNLLRKTR